VQLSYGKNTNNQMKRGWLNCALHAFLWFICLQLVPLSYATDDIETQYTLEALLFQRDHIGFDVGIDLRKLMFMPYERINRDTFIDNFPELYVAYGLLMSERCPAEIPNGATIATVRTAPSDAIRLNIPDENETKEDYWWPNDFMKYATQMVAMSNGNVGTSFSWFLYYANRSQEYVKVSNLINRLGCKHPRLRYLHASLLKLSTFNDVEVWHIP